MQTEDTSLLLDYILHDAEAITAARRKLARAATIHGSSFNRKDTARLQWAQEQIANAAEQLEALAKEQT